jgi:hypothetical protein
MISKDWEGSNFYKDLEVSPDATAAEIKSAFREALRTYHPDLNSQSDQSQRFQAITKAYAVLKDAKSRDMYDDYLFGSIEMPRRRVEAKTKDRKASLLFRAALFILILLLLKSLGLIGVQQQVNQNTSETSTGKNNQDNNQVLALMVGPVGPPGPAGVAGKDGFIGLNGYQGKDGIAGAPGKVGEQGATGPVGPAGPAGAQGIQGLQGAAGSGVVIISLSSGDANCADGGTKFVSSTGAISYACNGGGGGSGSLGTGYVAIGTCDASAKISLETAYVAGQFKMNAIVIDELAGKCNGQTLTAVLKIKSDPISATGSPGYVGGDSYLCTTVLSLDPNSGNNANLISLTSANCKNTTSNATNFNNVWALDVSTASDGLLLQIS